MASRRLRTFKRWMKSQRIECSDALELVDSSGEGISIRALCNLKEGDVVAKIPKSACLTIKTSGAHEMIESAALDGYLGLSVALMCEKSLGEESPWAGYLQLLPHQESLPLVWSLDEVDSLLCGTELHKIVKEDKALIYEDWKENILPLMDSPLVKLNSRSFGLEQYFSAKSLIASRSFEIDGYHGFGMVPLADLFNHKTGAEDVHFTNVSSYCESESDADDNNDENDHNLHEDIHDNEPSTQNSFLAEQVLEAATTAGENSYGGTDLENSSAVGDDPMVLEMIMVKDVRSGAEVFNTYGSLGNAALLHRYGFTEANNPYDIVNIDLELVLKWSSSLFSSRYSRYRLSLWRRLDYFGCVSQNSEYFEISSNGEPQIELLILLCVMLMEEDTFHKINGSMSTKGNKNGLIGMCLSGTQNIKSDKTSDLSKARLLTRSVCEALLALADMRESLYGSNSLQDDIEALNSCCRIRDRKLYHSLMLRVSERRILEKLRAYAAAGGRLSTTPKRSSMRKKLKRTDTREA